MHGAWRVDQDVPNPQELGSEFPASAPCPPPFSLQSQLSQEVIDQHCPDLGEGLVWWKSRLRNKQGQ